MHIINRIAAFHDEMTAWRRDLHAHPETAFEEHRTAAFVAEQLRSWGIEVHRASPKPAWSGRLKRGNGARHRAARRHGRAADGGAERVRAPLQRPGKIHGCGHDGHTAMLLGAARYLAETAQFRRHGAFHLSARRGERRRRRRDGERGLVREIPDRRPCTACTTGRTCRSANSPCGQARHSPAPTISASSFAGEAPMRHGRILASMSSPLRRRPSPPCKTSSAVRSRRSIARSSASPPSTAARPITSSRTKSVYAARHVPSCRMCRTASK